MVNCRLRRNRNKLVCLRKIPKKNLTWKQAKRLYPRLKAKGDYDKDGVMNSKDCRPFNKKKQDDYGEGYYSNKDLLASSRLVKAMDIIRYGRELGLPPRDTHNELKEKGYSGQEMRDALDLYHSSLEGKRIGVYG